MFALKGLLAATVLVVVAANPLEPSATTPKLEIDSREIDVRDAQETTPSPMSRFRHGLTPYEKRIRIFMENIRREYFTMNTNSTKFLNELDTYLDQLPVNETKLATEKYRSRCYCEGRTWTPCPERCLYSCYMPNYGGSGDDCRGHSSAGYACYCYDGSSTRCDSALDNCFEEKVEPIDPCANYTTDRSLVKSSFSRFSNLLVEPLKILLRGLEFKLTSFRQSVIATDLLYDATSQLCDEADPQCFPEAAELLTQKLKHFQLLKRNITLNMIDAQNKAELVAKDVDDLKEQTFNQINQSIKEYSCCLKGLKFTVKDNACSPNYNVSEALKGTTTSTPPTISMFSFIMSCPSPNFKCTNERCISDDLRCNGEDNCGDYSDEMDC